MRPRPDPAIPRHPPEIQRLHDTALARTGVRSRFVRTDDGAALHLLEAGSGPPVILVHGSVSAALFWMPLLSHLRGVRVLAPDRPGHGLSDPVDLPAERIREAAVSWLDRVLDALELPAATLVGHSMGGLWALWFAMAKPERVDRLAMLGTPTLPGTRAPLPFRMLATPGLGALIGGQRQTPTSVRRFATMMGEGEAITRYPDLIELMVATGRDPVAQAVGRPEVRTIISPLALLTRSGFRRSMRVRHDELRRLSIPTLLMWGEHDPLATVETARRSIASLPQARLEHFPGGHLPFLDVPRNVADGLNAFFDEQPSRTGPRGR